MPGMLMSDSINIGGCSTVLATRASERAWYRVLLLI